MDKKVFISHSSKDKTIAAQICKIIEDKEIGCWIAPRDIPYGNEWAGEITKALKQTRICIFLFSENSNHSKQVAREIQIAFDNEVVIIPVRLENVEMNDVLTYYLATMHWILEYDEKTLLNRVEEALLTPKVQKNKQNADVSLQKNFDEYFSDNNISLVLEKDPILNRMRKRISKKHMDKLADNLLDIRKTEEKAQSKIDSMESQNYEKHFSIVDNEGQVTIAFEVLSVLDEGKKAFVRCYLEELDYNDKPLSSGRTKRTFCINYPHYYGMPIYTRIVLLTFCPKEHCLFINNGVAEENKVSFSKCPQVEFWDSDSKNATPNCNYVIEVKDAHVEYDANNKSDIIIINLETFEVIKRQKQFDSIMSDWKTTIKLDIDKQYFVIKLQCEESATDNMTIALGYLHGIWGISHDILNAIDLLQDDKSAKSKYILAKVFENDDMLKDDDDYIYYLTQSAELGYIEAMLRLSNEYIDGVHIQKSYAKAKKLLETILSKDPKNGTAWNNLGWLYKNGYGCQVDYYEACNAFKVATECGTKQAFKHLAQIALLSNEKTLSYTEGLYYLCCAEKLGVKNIDEIFLQYAKRIDNYSQVLDSSHLHAAELQFQEYENTKTVVQDTYMSNHLNLVGGFPKWS